MKPSSALRSSIRQIPRASLHEVPAGHGPWLADAGRVADLTAAKPLARGIRAQTVRHAGAASKVGLAQPTLAAGPGFDVR